MLAVKACCAKFAVAATPQSGLSHAQVEQSEDGEWDVNGCCGGGCYVLDDIKFCPFCGTKLPSTPAVELTKEEWHRRINEISEICATTIVYESMSKDQLFDLLNKTLAKIDALADYPPE